MKVVDLSEKHEQLYFVCLEDWSEEIKEAGEHKANWYHKMKDKGLRVKLALDGSGEVGGMIQYVPIEHSFAEGYKKADNQNMAVLLWKPFSGDASPPKWIREKKKPQKVPGEVTVTAFLNGWCPAQNMVFERAKRAAAEFGDNVKFRDINTFDREVFAEWGIADALFIDDKQVRTGPPPSSKKIKR
jgi:hypothetical protein